MKNSLLLFLLSACSLGSAVSSATAQNSAFGPTAAGVNPIGRVYSPPSYPQSVLPSPTPTGAMPPGMYNNNGGFNPAGMPAYSNEPLDVNHKLSSGDQLSFRVVEDRDDKSDTLPVTAEGKVNIPLIGLMSASGQTVPEFAAAVKSALERDYYYHATVIMGLNSAAPRQSRGRVFVTGAVHQVGPMELPANEKLTVSKALIAAGGPMQIADLHRVRVLNKDGVDRGVKVDFSGVLKGKSKSDLVLEPGDTIVVPERPFLW